MGRALPLLCYCPKSAQQTPFKSPPSTRIERLASVAPTVRSTAVTRASGAPPAAVGGAAFGPTSSDAVSEHGHGHHLFQTESETGAAIARSRAGFSRGGIMRYSVDPMGGRWAGTKNSSIDVDLLQTVHALARKTRCIVENAHVCQLVFW